MVMCVEVWSAVADGSGQVDVKKLATLVVAGIVLFYVITQPNQAGNAVQDILGWLRDGAEAIITFMKSIFA
jgi:hypothetical protein